MRVPILLKIPTFCLVAFGLISLFGHFAFTSVTIPWKEADEGLLVAELESVFDDSPYEITVVKVDPERYSFQLLCATELGKEPLTTKEWALKYQMLAAVNAGMFRRTV